MTAVVHVDPKQCWLSWFGFQSRDFNKHLETKCCLLKECVHFIIVHIEYYVNNIV